MKLDPQDRAVPAYTPDRRSYFVPAALAIVFVACATSLAVFPKARETAKAMVFGGSEALGIKLPGSNYGPVYQRLGIEPLPARMLASSRIASGLEKLAHEPCDKTAIFAFSEGLLAASEGRTAANAYAAFAASCPNGEGEQYRAAEILLLIGDTEKAIAITSALIDRSPAVVPYRYLRGKALAGAKRYAEAVEDYKSTIELQKEPRNIGDWVFVEMANIYAAMNRPCDAVTTILAWVAIDPSTRDTLNARKMVEAYSAKGCTPQERPPVDVKKL
jgi:tetratricopeptide (TPR) repeat protein